MSDWLRKLILGKKGMDAFQRDPLAFLRVTIVIALILIPAIWWTQGLLYKKQLADKDSEISYLKSIQGSKEVELSLSPQQEKLLRLIDKYMLQFGANKLMIALDGLIKFDEPSRKDIKINIADELFEEENSYERAKQLETLMDSMPPEYLRRLPESRLGSPFVVIITDAGRKYLKR